MVEKSARQSFSILKSTAVLVGMVVGTGIFSFPPLIAQNSQNPMQYLLIWLLGGVVSLMGAFCYAELASIFPNSGGEYTYLKGAYGKSLGFIFVWARMVIIQTGSIAIIAFIFGDYASSIVNLGTHSSSIFAFFIIIIFTLINIWGTKYAQNAQIGLTGIIIFLIVALSGYSFYQVPIDVSDYTLNTFELLTIESNLAGPALIFVLLTYGGWNETSYLSGEMKDVNKNMIKTLLYGIVTITILYLFINLAFLQVIGFEALKTSTAVGYDLTQKLLGPVGSNVVVFLIIICALSTLNASILTGARTNFIMGQEYPLFKFMGHWNTKNNSPIQALIFQCLIALVFVGLGFFSQEKIRAIVDFTAPVFWFFLLLITLSIFILRHKVPKSESHFKMPLFPIPALLFLAACLYLFYSSIRFTGIYALYGMGVLIVGILFWLYIKYSPRFKLKK